MAAKPRTTYDFDDTGPAHTFVAAVSGYGEFRVCKHTSLVLQRWSGSHRYEEVGELERAASDYDTFKMLFAAWWDAIAPWENIAYDIVVYDRFGRPLGAATAHKPLVAKRRMRELAETHNGARGIVLRRNKRTLEVTQVAGFKRRTSRATAVAP